MAIDTILVGNANTFSLTDFRNAISGDLESDVEAYASICEKRPANDKWLVEGASTENPVVITSTGHGLTTGQQITIVNVGDNRAAHGTFAVTVLNANTFSLDGCDGSGEDEWTKGGEFYRCIVDAESIPFELTGDGQYQCTVDGELGFDVGTTYIAVFYCLGAYRDLYNEINRITARRRGNA